jgi:hypothetical protein
MADSRWPDLPLASWQDTRDTLQLWTQIAGKICLALTPRVNHFWNIAMQLTPRGLATPPMSHRSRTFTLTFDLIGHEAVLEMADGTRDAVALRPQTVAEFYAAMLSMLRRHGIDVRIWRMPVELPSPIPFDQDTVHKAYDAQAARQFLELLLAVKPVFDRFRAEFIGKSSPVHFFWGSFDLALTRFSGRRAPERSGADSITRESYSHEVISHGWWPGSGAIAEPAFYAYAAPEPDGFKTVPVEPAAAFYSPDFSEFVLPYEAVRTAPSPADALYRFLRTTYDAGAALASWDRDSLERPATEWPQSG